MKKLSLPSLLAASALLCGVTAFSPQLAAQDQSQTPAQPTAQTQTQAQGQMQEATKVFTGKITKDGDKLVLKDAATNLTYQLDDQAKAKKFEGKEVKVTGSFDANSNTIHVENIEAAAR